MGGKVLRQETASHPLLPLNFTHCPCLLSSTLHLSFKFIPALFLSQPSLPSPLRVAEFFEVLQSLFISMSEFLTDGSALVEQQSGYEMWWLEKHWVGKSTPQGNLMKWDCWVLWGSFERARCQRCESSDLLLVVWNVQYF